MILILMTSRSGSSLVAKIFAAHGFNTGGEEVHSCGYETFENARVNQWIRDNKPQLKLATAGSVILFRVLKRAYQTMVW